jgi:hypothetical protein
MLIQNVYTIQSFRGGISDENDKGIRGSFKFGYGLDIRGRDDVLQCGQALVKESASVVTDLILFIIPCSNGKAYGFGDAGCIYERSGTTWVKRYTDANGAIKGADEWNGYLYWACDTEISRIPIASIPTATWTTEVEHDWNTTLTAATWHTMIKATGNLLIANDQYLAMIDYSTPAVFSAAALDLIPGNLAKCFEEDGDYVIVGSTKEGNDEQGHLWTWEPTALNWVQKKKLASKGVNALITTELMLAQCGIDGEVYFSDMASKVPVFVFPDGGSAGPGGVCAKKALALFGISGNSSAKCGVYSYGRSKKNYPFALNLDYVPSPAILTTIVIGAVQMVNGTLLVAWQNSTTYGVDALSVSTKASGVYESLEWNGGKPFQKKNFFQTKIVMDALPSGASLVLKYKLNRASSWTTAKTIDGNSSFSTADETRAIFNINAKGETIELRLELTSTSNSTIVIRSVSTYFNIDDKIII